MFVIPKLFISIVRRMNNSELHFPLVDSKVLPSISRKEKGEKGKGEKGEERKMGEKGGKIM